MEASESKSALVCVVITIMPPSAANAGVTAR
jgi:hypothetical protein